MQKPFGPPFRARFINIVQTFGARIRRDIRGAAAVEFALILPFLLILLTGLVELTNYMMVSRKIVASTQVVGDLVGVEISVNAGKMNNIFAATSSLLAPFSTNQFRIAVASVRYDQNTGVASEDWQSVFNSGSIANSAVIGDGFGGPGDSVIVVQADYTYVPLVSSVFPLDLSITETAFVRPRRVRFVDFN